MFKKIIAPLFFPVPLCLEVMLFGLLLLWFSRKQRTGKILVSIGVLLLVILSYNAVPNIILRPLEYKYSLPQMPDNFSKVKWVIVLGGGHTSDPQIPITSQLSDSSLVRLVEGIRIYRTLPESKLILSGGGPFDPVPNAQLLADVALALGVDKQDLVLESLSRDTKDEVLFIKEIVGNDAFILVTSASHMPRSMALFQKLGMEPIPAPTDHWVKKRQGISPAMFFPSSNGLRKAERAFYEYLGLAWANLRGQI